ncbi:LEPR-XLL domain-containing protein, partial [Pseudomonas denitrificans (nom. rej.)]|nr:LEPR-XLL domain-containing protein [Pseudomonas denitrificans (nom. rej.)]
MQWIKRVFGEAARRQQVTGISQPTLIMALEPRMMFDGAVAATAAEAAKPTDAQDAAAADKAGASSASKDNADSSHAATSDARSDAGQGAAAGSGRNVVFVDS